jgi:hypothetical protein
MFVLAAGFNLPKMRKKASDPSAGGPIPIIAGNTDVFERLCQARELERKDKTDVIDETIEAAQKAEGRLRRIERDRQSSGAAYSQDVLERMARSEKRARNELAGAIAARAQFEEMVAAIDATEILSPEQKPLSDLDPEQSKLKLLGHGSAGSDRLATVSDGDDDEQEFSLRELAYTLKLGGLNPQLTSFDLLSCESADVEHRASFVEDPPCSTAAGMAPAQIFANELREAGFVNPMVKGYQGLGKIGYPGKHSMRFLVDDEGNVVGKRRASEVAKVFTPR